MIIFQTYFILIYFTCFVTAIVSATFGFLGGTILLAVLAQFMRMDAVIPIHGFIQLISNSSRAWMLRPHISWLICRESIIGTIIGGIVGYFYLIQIPENVFNVCLGFFILFVTFVPKFKANIKFKYKWLAIGFLVSSVGLFMGAVGTLVGSLLFAENLERKPMVATQAMLQSVVHVAKIIVFTMLGFSLAPWIYLIAGCVVATYAGTYVGTKVLDKIPQKLFRTLITIILVGLSIRLIWSGFVTSTV